MSKKISIINGPNLNLLGKREPEVYGKETLDDVNNRLRELGKKKGVQVDFFQSNIEGEIVTEIQKANEFSHGIILNAGGYSHTSVAIRDALSASKIKKIEVHISNIYAREPFRHVSLVSAVVDGVICGLGTEGYDIALQYLVSKLNA